MGRLKSIEHRVSMLEPGRVSPQAQSDAPFARSWTAALRLTGRALQTRNNRIKQRDKYICQHCGTPTDVGQVDHRVPLSEGGSDEDYNLQWLCISGEAGGCHGIKTKAENKARS